MEAQVKTLRLAFHVFLDDGGNGNFQPDSIADNRFLEDLTAWVNHRLGHLDTLKPAMPSPFVPDAGFRIRLDTIYFHRDSLAWDCSGGIRAPYMRERYVDQDTAMTYIRKFQTLPVFFGGNHPVAGGETMGLGDKGYIAVRGYYHQYLYRDPLQSLDECGRNLIHELGHCLGLPHNFTGGPNGEQCDNCEDNGCTVEGTSNNIMDYWPGYGHALSRCQYEIIQLHLRGEQGDIAEVLVNDGCRDCTGPEYAITAGDTLVISDSVYFSSPILVRELGTLVITGYLSMPSGCPVYLEPGSVLLIEGGRIGNLCGDLWPGVNVIEESPGEAPLIRITSGGGIDNARISIRAPAGSINEMQDAVFRNSIQNLVLEGAGTDTIQLNDCQFIITRKLNRYEEGVTPVSFIEAGGAGFLKVKGCSFINEPGTYLFDADFCGSGILSEGLGIEILSSEFRNLFRGVGVCCPQNGRMINISGNKFIHNRCGLHADFKGLIRVEDNLFRLQRFNRGSTIGLRLEEPERFIIKHNHFESTYGSGSMAGIYLFNPGTAASLVSGNQWNNIPAGIFMEGHPPVDSLLLSLAEPDSGLARFTEYGPQFRNNSFLDTPVNLAVATDSSHGIAIGYPPDFKTDAVNPAWDWPAGGYAMYTDNLRLSGFRGWNSGHSGERREGLYLSMNYIGMNDGRRQKAEIRNQKEDIKKKDGWDFAEVESYLAAYTRISGLIDDPGFADIFSFLPEFKRVPAVLRSGNLSTFSERFSVGGQPWLRVALSGIAGGFVRADSLVALLAERQALLNDSLWNKPVSVFPETAHSAALKWPDVPSSRYDLPDLKFFRFTNPAVAEGLPPAFDLWPNPVEEVLHVYPEKGYIPDGEWILRIFSSSGNLLKTWQITGWEDLAVPVADLPGGLYIAMLSDAGGNIGNRKFIKVNQLPE